MTSKTMWMIRAGQGGTLFDDFKENGIVKIGLPRIGDLSDLRSRSAITEELDSRFPEWSKGKRGIWAGQLYRFANKIEVGDDLLTYDPSRRVYLLGTVGSDYIHDTSQPEGWTCVRRVNWREEIDRDILSVSTKNSLGAISSLFRIPTEAASEILRAKEGGLKKEEVEADAESEEDILFRDIETRALEFIQDRINRLDWEEMQKLVAGLLRAMGYKTVVSPDGPDRGKDIVASPDGFGFEAPRIVVEVKHRKESMGSQQIRSFLGGRHPDDKGLYVSTGGFTKEALYEAERANIPVKLMNLPELVNALLENYEKLDIETQRLVPLKKTYLPV